MDRVDLRTTHEEVNVIIPRQVAQTIEEGAVFITVICDDTDVFVLLLYIFDDEPYMYSVNGKHKCRQNDCGYCCYNTENQSNSKISSCPRVFRP
ncbi:hypothetical protein DPMN_037859 [Dreissena polymorpha]|uniref:Uncharacterized protein n=1 Tax=Dreissena polymorpha TaxID=45954 RepID=A0A9D4MEB9_DREPO|nr:hypothetical protein DPMN_037859 [Dreissena polymorpha]